MAGGVTTTGLDQYRLAVRALPAVLARELQTTARQAAARMQAAAQATARSRGWSLADEIETEHIPREQAYRVFVRPRSPRPDNLPLWLEYGTVKMSPRPFWGPAERTTRLEYPRSVDAAIQRAADGTVNR